MSDEPTRREGDPPLDPVMATFSDWLDHAVACMDACAGRACRASGRCGWGRGAAAGMAARAARRNACD